MLIMKLMERNNQSIQLTDASNSEVRNATWMRALKSNLEIDLENRAEKLPCISSSYFCPVCVPLKPMLLNVNGETQFPTAVHDG